MYRHLTFSILLAGCYSASPTTPSITHTRAFFLSFFLRSSKRDIEFFFRFFFFFQQQQQFYISKRWSSLQILFAFRISSGDDKLIENSVTRTTRGDVQELMSFHPHSYSYSLFFASIFKSLKSLPMLLLSSWLACSSLQASSDASTCRPTWCIFIVVKRSGSKSSLE